MRSKVLFIILLISICSVSLAENFYAPLSDLTDLQVEGKHRFKTIAGMTGFQPTSVHTKAFIETKLHQGDQGTVSFWFSPLEELDFFMRAGRRHDKERHAYNYPLLSDVFPPTEDRKMNFGIFWSIGDPLILAKFTSGGTWDKMDYSMPPFAMIEKILMHPGHWYLLSLIWDKNKKMIEIYVNGRLMGFNYEAEDFAKSGDKIYIGCPMFIMKDLMLEDKIQSRETIKAAYHKRRPDNNEYVDQEIDKLITPVYGALSDLKRDESWRKSYFASFTKESDIKDWLWQTNEEWVDSMVVKTTPQGLLFKTPEKIDNGTRLTLWSPQNFEGDLWMEVDFRLESPRGLALIIICASGVGREDFIEDHGLQMVGNMSPILTHTRNYHWEFVRRVNVIRTDMETQVVYKNPWGRHLYFGAIPSIEQGRWYKLRWVKTGNRLQGSLDGKIVFDAEDDPHLHTGPVLNYGRIALRHMYHTAIRYRNLVVYER